MTELLGFLLDEVSQLLRLRDEEGNKERVLLQPKPLPMFLTSSLALPERRLKRNDGAARSL
jgi:hypothetical protein